MISIQLFGINMPTSCQQTGCKKQAQFGLLGSEPNVCKQHVKENMLMFPNIQCCFSLCLDFASFGNKNKQPLFCDKHRTDDSVYLIHKTCEDCQSLFLPKVITTDLNEPLNNESFRKKCTNCYDDELEYIQKKLQELFRERIIDNQSQLQNAAKQPVISIKSLQPDQLILVFVKSKNMKEETDADFENMQYIAEVLQKKITYIYLNTKPYKAYQKSKTQNPDMETRLLTLQDIIQQYQLQELSRSKYISKYLYFDGFNI